MRVKAAAKLAGVALALTFVAPAHAAAQGGMSIGDRILLDDLRMRQEAAERRALDQTNQVMALEARLQAERSVLDLRTQANPPPPPRLDDSALERTAPAPLSFPAIPDAILEDSNRRVRQAAAGRP